MAADRFVCCLIGLVLLIDVIDAYLTNADEELVLIDEGPGRFFID